MSTVKKIVNSLKMTNHALDRFFERFPKIVSEKNLKRDDFYAHTVQNTVLWKELLKPFILASTENRYLLNDTNRMVAFYERYGYDHCPIYLDNVELRARFVFIEDKKVFLLLTIIPMDVERIRPNLKYKAKNPKKDVMLYDLKVKSSSHTEVVDPVKEKAQEYIYLNPGNVKGADGYYLSQEEKFAAQNVNLRVKMANITQKMKRVVKKANYNLMLPDENNFYTFEINVDGYLIKFKSRIGLVSAREIVSIKDLNADYYNKEKLNIKEGYIKVLYSAVGTIKGEDGYFLTEKEKLKKYLKDKSKIGESEIIKVVKEMIHFERNGGANKDDLTQDENGLCVIEKSYKDYLLKFKFNWLSSSWFELLSIKEVNSPASAIA